ncbi:hypothetical protein [Streptomyces griseus]|uniref:hypothetical protein n=1 Tax=Streptomyces griseus TaxID=1911 RepID=UPI003659A934
MTDTTPTPADQLRAAADLLREAAGHATPGPWRTHDTHLGGVGGHTATVLTDRPNLNDTELIAWLPTMSHEPWDEARNAWRNAGWMALVHPGVGLALAAWLESWVGVDLSEHGPMPEDAQHALAVARQLLDGAPAPAVWVDGDPLMEAIAAAVYEQCGTDPVSSVVVDDPRNIAAVAAAVARQLLGTTEGAGAEPSADRRARYEEALWVHALNVAAAATAVMAVADAEQASLRAEAEGLDEALRGAISASALPAPAAAPLAEVWTVWRENETTVYGHFATLADARQGTIDCWQDDEPVCPDYSWRKVGPNRLELVVGGVHGGVYASRHRVYGAPPAPADRAAVLREAADAALAVPTPDCAEMSGLTGAWEAGQWAAVAELRHLADGAAAGVQPPTEGDPLADCATEYRVPVPENGGTELRLRKGHAPYASGWSVAVPGYGGGKALTELGWSDSIGALSADRLFCWPDPATAVDAARRALAAPAAPEEPTR